MRVILGLLAGALCVTLITSEAFGMAWGSSRHGRYEGSTGSGNTPRSVPEPGTLYVIGSALTALGGAGWFLRRRK